MKKKIKQLDEQIARVKEIDHEGARNSLLKVFTQKRVEEVDKIGRKARKPKRR